MTVTTASLTEQYQALEHLINTGQGEGVEGLPAAVGLPTEPEARLSQQTGDAPALK